MTMLEQQQALKASESEQSQLIGAITYLLSFVFQRLIGHSRLGGSNTFVTFVETIGYPQCCSEAGFKTFPGPYCQIWSRILRMPP